MLNVQKYLMGGKTLDDLSKEYSIDCVFNDTENLVALNYCQINSPKYNEVVRDCRGLVLEVGSWNCIASSFRRFYNYGEDLEGQKKFDWSKAKYVHKLDGSLGLLYWYDGKWCVNTRGSFAKGRISSLFDTTWEQYIFEGFPAGISPILPRNYTYVYEITGLLNKVVVPYKERKNYLLAIFDKEGNEIVNENTLDDVSGLLCTPRPPVYDFTDTSSLLNFVKSQPFDYEGIVVNDGLQRIKVKNPAYVAVHSLKGNNGSNINSVKNIVDLLLANETDEVKTVLPEFSEILDLYKLKYDQMKEEVDKLWKENKNITDKKAFALKVNKSRWSGMLFIAKREHDKGNVVDFQKIFEDARLSLIKNFKEI